MKNTIVKSTINQIFFSVTEYINATISNSPTRQKDQLRNQWTQCVLTAEVLHLYSEIQVMRKPLFHENEQTPVTETKNISCCQTDRF